MNPIINSEAVGYIASATVIIAAIVGMVSCNAKPPSDEAVRAVSASCEKAGLVAHVTVMASQTVLGCVVAPK